MSKKKNTELKLKFKQQQFQDDAVQAVVDCFDGQPRIEGVSYRIDPGVEKAVAGKTMKTFEMMKEVIGMKNAEFVPDAEQILENIRNVQYRQNLFMSKRLGIHTPDEFAPVPGAKSPKKTAKKTTKKAAKNLMVDGCLVNLDVEMETGTGKTYCYIKTMYELYKQYGWSKFIIVVPSVAIREGVQRSIQTTSDHFNDLYGHRIKSFIYNSSQLHEIEAFSSNAGINVMVINVQAFNTTSEAQRRIYDILDDFQSRKPIDVISANRPILILDEPQKMEGESTLKMLGSFKPLMILRYSATHKTQYNKVYRLDAVDAYNQRLVKKISVCGVTVKGLTGTNAYLYLRGIDISSSNPIARMELEVRHKGGTVKRTTSLLDVGTKLHERTGLDAYKNLRIEDINAAEGFVQLGGEKLYIGQANGSHDEMLLRRIQIRETIREHLEKERELFPKRIKVLSLFFIDKVALYRDYDQEDNQGEYARIFEQEYDEAVKELFEELPFEEDAPYREYLKGIITRETHNGYFSIDKKSGKLKDPDIGGRGEEKGHSKDPDAYDLILKDKERLLSFEEPTRFIFSHSALREGWDNPNVFVMCMLKQSDNTMTRRQEVGRGLRLAVDQSGERMDHPREAVHDINRLTVIANESYSDFVDGLQKEIVAELSSRPRLANADYFKGKVFKLENGDILEIDEKTAKLIEDYLVKNDYVDVDRHILEKYHDDLKAGALGELPAELQPYKDQVLQLVNSVFSEALIPEIDNKRKEQKNKRNDEMFKKKEFQKLWSRINQKAVYRVEFDSKELIDNCVKSLNSELLVTPLQYVLERGTQQDEISESALKNQDAFDLDSKRHNVSSISAHSSVSYDLLGKLVGTTRLTRKTVAAIISQLTPEKFAMFKMNPEQFIGEVSRLINEQKACIVIDKLTYDEIAETHDSEIFTASYTMRDAASVTKKLKKHVYEYAETDSKVEKSFAEELDLDESVVVYAKLPRGFSIPTPMGEDGYRPDWAIVFKEGSVKHIYFVAETKGSMSSLQISPMEKKKIECARKFFKRINEKFKDDKVKYDVVDSFAKLLDIVSK